MQYVRLGSSSLKISRVGLGAMAVGDPAWRSWVLDEAAARPLIVRAVEQGINFIDTCDFYSNGVSEAVLGKILQDLGLRNSIVIATKFGNPMGPGPNARGYSRKHVVEAVEASLSRLRTDRIDLYQTHIWDTAANIEELASALDLLVRQGKVLYVGATDIPCWQLARAVYGARHRGEAPFISLQHHYNPVWREDERDLIPFCRSEGLGLLPYSPIARGFLAGRRRREDKTTERARTDEYAWSWYGRLEDAALAEGLEKIADGRGVKPAQIALAWVLKSLPESTPIFGATRLEHVEHALMALDIELTEDEFAIIERAYAPRKRGGHW